MNINVIERMKLQCYSVGSGVSISAFKVSISCILIEIPGGMYTHVFILNMKIHENCDFLHVFTVNGRLCRGLYNYVNDILISDSLTSIGKL